MASSGYLEADEEEASVSGHMVITTSGESERICTAKSQLTSENESNRTNITNEFDEADLSIKIIHENPIQRANNEKLENCSDSVDGEDIAAESGPSRGRKIGVEEQEFCLEKEAEEERVPDGGWGWIVVFGASLILVLVDTVGQCFGIIFSRFLLQMETSTVMTAWIFNLFSFIWCMTGPPLGPLITEFGWRCLAFMGSILLTIATITSAFVPAAWVLFFTYSLMAGAGCGIISNISYMIVPHYFKKRRGLANGIIMAWDCGGQLIGPPFIEILQKEYAFTGATLILGGIILNCCVGAAVFHPVKWHLKPRSCSNPMSEATQELSHTRKNPSSEGKSPPAESQWKILLRLMNSTLNNLTILKSLKAIILSVAVTVIFNGYLNFLALVPFAMEDEGHSLADAAACVSVSAICNMATRVVVATLSDSKRFNFRISMIIGSLTISGAMVCFTFIKDLTLKKLVMGVWGCGVGTFMSVFNLVMVHYMGLDNLMPMMGASMLCIAFGNLTIGPFAGYVRDVSQSYAVCIWFLSGVVLSAFVLWLLMPAAAAYDLRRQNNKYNIEKEKAESIDAKDLVEL